MVSHISGLKPIKSQFHKFHHPKIDAIFEKSLILLHTSLLFWMTHTSLSLTKGHSELLFRSKICIKYTLTCLINKHACLLGTFCYYKRERVLVDWSFYRLPFRVVVPFYTADDAKWWAPLSWLIYPIAHHWGQLF